MNHQLRTSAAAAAATFLGALALAPLFVGFRWLGPVVVVIVCVAGASLLIRSIPGVAGAAPLAAAAGYLCALTALYAPSQAIAGFLPGPAAVHALGTTLSSGFTDTTEMSAPVSPTTGISLITTGGIGLVAVIIDILATTLRRPALAGLPLLAVFTVPAAVLTKGVGWVPFVFAAAGYLLLLVVEGRERLAGWGRSVVGSAARRWGAAGSVGRQIARSGRGIAAMAITIAVVVPLAIPGLHAGWFGTHHTGNAGVEPGGHGATIQPFVTLRRDLTRSTPIPEFTYTSTGEPGYFRMLTLDEFDGTTWRATGLASGDDISARELRSGTGGREVVTTVTVSGLREAFLPVPQVPVAVDVDGPWKFNTTTQVFYNPQGVTRADQRYTVVSRPLTPSATELAEVSAAVDPSVATYLQYPSSIPQNIKQLADQIVAGARTPYQKAIALQNWFLANFTYDLDAKSGSSTNALESFLRDRTGYCEQFAATMALMARMEGIPSRVDIGFTPGTQIPGTNRYLVTTADAHAWPELYFSGIGWLRFEPTPRGDGQATVPPYGAGGTVPSATLPPTPGASAPQVGNIPSVAPGGAAAPNAGTQSGGEGLSLPHIPLPLVGLVGLIVLAVLCGPTARWWVRQRRWSAADDVAARVHAAWAELGDDLRDLGLDWSGETDTPRRAATALAASTHLRFQEDAREALLRLARAEEIARYAGPLAAQRLSDTHAERDHNIVRRALREAVPRGRRIRALLLPASIARGLRTRRAGRRATIP